MDEDCGNSKQITRRTLRGKTVSRVATGPLAVHFCARRAGVSLRDYTLDPQVLADCVIRYYEEFRPDAVWISADTWVTAEAMGKAVIFPGHDQPLTGTPERFIRSSADLAKIPPPDPSSQGRWPRMLEAVRRVVEAVGEEVFVVACFDQYPFSLACALMGMEQVMLALWHDRALLEALLERCAEYTIGYASVLAAAGVDMLSGGDSPAGLIGPRFYRDVALPAEQRVIAAVKLRSPLPISLHICGNAMPILADMVASRADVLEVDHQIDMAAACRIVPAETALWGNLDPVRILARGSVPQVRGNAECLGERRGIRASPVRAQFGVHACRRHAVRKPRCHARRCSGVRAAFPATRGVSGRKDMTDQSFGVLVLGAGWVSSQHVAAYQHNPHTRVLAVCDRSLEQAERRVAESGLSDVACYDDPSRALAHASVDIVSICTPQHVHCRHVLAAAEAGKHMIIEKPVGISLGELHQMRAAVRRAGVRTVVSFVLRWNPWFQMLKAMIADNALGRPYYVEADYLSYNGSWWSGWNNARTLEQGVSAMLVGGCHAVDALRWFAAPGQFEAATPVEVFAVSGGHRKGSRREYNPTLNTWANDAPPMEYDGLEVALVKFDNGTVGKVSTNAECIMPYRFPLRIFGSLGTVIDNRVWSHKYPGQTDWVELPTILPDSSHVAHHPFQAEIDHLVECLRSGRESHCNLEDAVKTHEIVFAAVQSCKSHQPVRLPLLDSME